MRMNGSTGPPQADLLYMPAHRCRFSSVWSYTEGNTSQQPRWEDNSTSRRAGPTILTSRPWTVHIDSARDAIAENHLIVSDLDVRDEEEGPSCGRRSLQGDVEAGGTAGMGLRRRRLRPR